MYLHEAKKKHKKKTKKSHCRMMKSAMERDFACLQYLFQIILLCLSFMAMK